MTLPVGGNASSAGAGTMHANGISDAPIKPFQPLLSCGVDHPYLSIGIHLKTSCVLFISGPMTPLSALREFAVKCVTELCITAKNTTYFWCILSAICSDLHQGCLHLFDVAQSKKGYNDSTAIVN
jgi:hypothetical protein